MTPKSRRMAGILLLFLPLVIYGGVSLVVLLVNDPRYLANPLRQDMWRAGHAHAGVLLILSLVALRYVDAARLSNAAREWVRHAIPAAAVLLPLGFFLSVADPSSREPNGLLYLVYLGALLLASALIVLGTGLIRSPE